MEKPKDIQKKVSALWRILAEKRKFVCQDFPKFRKQYFKRYHRCPDASFHHEIAETLMQITRKRGARVAIAAPRESAKSTIVTLEFVIYCICYRGGLSRRITKSGYNQSCLGNTRIASFGNNRRGIGDIRHRSLCLRTTTSFTPVYHLFVYAINRDVHMRIISAFALE